MTSSGAVDSQEQFFAMDLICVLPEEFTTGCSRNTEVPTFFLSFRYLGNEHIDQIQHHVLLRGKSNSCGFGVCLDGLKTTDQRMKRAKHDSTYEDGVLIPFCGLRQGDMLTFCCVIKLEDRRHGCY